MGNEVKKTEFFALLVRIWKHLSLRRRRQLIFLLGLMFLSSMAEVVSLGMVIPFIAALTNPETLYSHPIVNGVSQYFGINSAGDLVLPLTIVFVAAALVAAAIRMLMLWVNTRLSYACGADVSLDVYKRTLYQPYVVHAAMNSSEVISVITNKVNSVTSIVNMGLQMISSFVLFIFVMSLLLITNPVVALIAVVVFGSGYIGISWITRVRLRMYGDRISRESNQVIKALQEGLGGIRDVLLDSTQSEYCRVYRESDLAMRQSQANVAIISGTPKFLMDALGMVLISILAYVLSQQGSGIASALPAMGILALSAQRLLPALQQMFHAWANIFGGQANLKDVLKLLDQELPEDVGCNIIEPLVFDRMEFKNVSYRYGSDKPYVLHQVSFEVVRGTRVGIVGSTGCGKTTTMDILMGLLEQTEGEVLVNGAPLVGQSKRAWQQTIAHVPQAIYLSDNTLAENIAFGVVKDEIDFEKVKSAAEQAQIAEFIESKPDGYQTTVGERGIQLSGGQRQRVGIARALYKKATVLVFDEATSALDNSTEKEVMNAINELSKDLTIVLIAHRISTLRNCDTIIELNHGKLVATGNYQELLDGSQSFRALAGVSV